MTDNTPLNAAAATPIGRLRETRLKRWHQNGEALLSFENLRSWLNTAGLVLFTPRPQIAAPAPSLAEAVLGATTPDPTLEQTVEARSLLARLIGEGVAVPLNLLGAQGGAAGETPDFVASAAVFSYIFTLRGDKLWKQPPATSGTNKVSALAAHTYEIIAKSGPRSASDLTPELGNAVTEVAVLRALSELWTHLRVLPLPQADGRPTLWELTSARYTKQIKAGANAGQPSALSALISLYLGQVAAATEDDIEVFLSPLAARSRVRDVLHALTAARQMDTIAVEGRTMVHLSGDAPDLENDSVSAEPREVTKPVQLDGEAGDAESAEVETAEAGDAPRIKKFVPKPRKVGTGYLAKGAPAKGPAKRFSSDRGGRPERPAFGKSERSSGVSRFGAKPDRERRPFQKSRSDGEAQPRFDKPWEENRPQRPAAGDPSKGGFAGSQSTADARPRREGRSGGESGGWKPAFREKSRTQRPPFGEGGARAPRGESGPRASRSEGGFAPRGDRGSERQGERPSRFVKSSDAPKRPFRRDAEGAGAGQGERAAKPFRRFDERPGGKRPFTPRGEGSGSGERRPPRPFTPRGEGGGSGDRRPPRPFTPRGEGGGSGDRRPPRPFTPHGEGSGSGDRRPSRPFTPRGEGSGSGDRSSRPFAPRGGSSGPGERGARPFRPRAEGGAERSGRPESPERRFGGGDRGPAKFASKFAGKRPGPRAEGGFSSRPRPAGKPGGGPFKGRSASAKGPAKRTFKRKEDESA